MFTIRLFAGIVVIGALNMFLAISVFAQTSDSVVGSVAAGDAVILADVNVTSAKLVSLNDGVLTFKFEAVNDYMSLSDIRYGVELIDAENDGDKLYSHVFSDILAIDAGEKVSREVSFELPLYINADAVVLNLHLETAQGLPLANLPVGDFMVPTNRAKGMIALNNCSVVVADVNGVATHYPVQFGVDIDISKEKLQLQCEITNKLGKQLEVVADIETYRQTMYTNKESIHKSMVVMVEPGISKIMFPIEPIKAPQSYINTIQLFDISSRSQALSNMQEFRYVVRGDSGTIRSITADKKSYSVGSEAIVSLVITGDADIFPNSRGAREFVSGKDDMIAQITINDLNGNICGSDSVAIEEQVLFKTSINIVNECMGAQVSVELTKNDKFLDKQNVLLAGELVTKKPVSGVQQVAQIDSEADRYIDKKYLLSIVVGVVLVILIFVLLVITFLRNRNNVNGIVLLALFGAMAGLMVGGVANAGTYTFGAGNTVTINTSSACERLTVSAKMFVRSCSNSPAQMNYLIDADGEIKSDKLRCIPSSSGCRSGRTVSVTKKYKEAASGVFGQGTLTFNKSNEVFDYKSNSLDIDMCTTPPQCGLSSNNDSGFYSAPTNGLCVDGDSSEVVEEGGEWRWDCSNGFGAVSCGANKLSACGSLDNGKISLNEIPGSQDLCAYGSPPPSWISSWSNWRYNLTGSIHRANRDDILKWSTFRWKCLADDNTTECAARADVLFCGDGIVSSESGETCDDGNTANGDGCSSACQIEAPVCGNGITETGEQCDGQSWCDSSCQIKQQETGACGSAEDSAACTTPTQNLCNSGASSGVTEDKPNQRWRWNCGGTACDTVSYCAYQEN